MPSDKIRSILHPMRAPGRVQAVASDAREPRTTEDLMHWDPASEVLVTERLLLEPVTVAMIEAVAHESWAEFEQLARARGPEVLPGPEIIHRGFGWSIDRIRKNPEWRLWGDRLMIARHGERRVLGSVIFHGHPGEEGIAEVGYGVEEAARGQGLATEATRACVQWALRQPAVLTVNATAHSQNPASIRVLEKIGMRRTATRDELYGELFVYSIGRVDVAAREGRAVRERSL
jgi:RimJ/RimL family protein N-acetyltransferase